METIAKIGILSAFLSLIGIMVYLIEYKKLSLKSGFVWLISYLSLSIIAIGYSLPVTAYLVYTIGLFGYMGYKTMSADITIKE